MNTKRNLATLAWLGCTVATLLPSACTEKEEEVKPDPVATLDASTGEGRGWMCPDGVSGAKLVLIHTSDGRAYCIDERVVVYSEYEHFLAAAGDDTNLQPAECAAFNETFAPKVVDPDSPYLQDWKCEPSLWMAETEPDRAVNCVNFCDAWAYCKWAGKRLCGVRGGDSSEVSSLGTAEVDTVVTSADSEWFNVCSQGGTTKYPYGDAYQPGSCVDEKKVQEEGLEAYRVADTSSSACHGNAQPYSDVYHMSGAVDQWLNICRQSGCVAQGGEWFSDPEALSCAGSYGVLSKPLVNVGLGIRCCADALPTPL